MNTYAIIICFTLSHTDLPDHCAWINMPVDSHHSASGQINNYMFQIKKTNSSVNRTSQQLQ